MTSWRKEEIEIADGTKVLAQMPVIVSASRSTDIPAFYSDWFMERLKAGYVKWFNPFNGVPLYVGKGGVNAREFTPDEMCTVAQRIGCADAGHVFDAERRKVVQTFRPRFHSPRRFAILVSAMLRQSFTDFIFATSTDGSGNAASYVRALDMFGPILTKQYPKPIVGGSMRHRFSLADLHTLHEWICDEMEKGAASSVLADFELSSCWTKDFCKVNELDAIGAKLAKFINAAAEEGGGR